jgi:hypothetical protein
MFKHLAIQNPENVCFNCLQEKEEGEINKIHITGMGYNSSFDNFFTQINLCSNCLKLTNPEWWKLEKVIDEDGYESYYEYEKEIFNFVKQMPIEGQELFYARYGYGACTGYMSGQDWIDYELGILPHEKCKEYGYYSPQEEEAYQKKFSVCDKVKIIIYDDNSKGCHCPFGTFGNKDGTSKGHQTQSGCYKCKLFKNREGEIATMTEEDFNIYELQSKLGLKILFKEIKNMRNIKI